MVRKRKLVGRERKENHRNEEIYKDTEREQRVSTTKDRMIRKDQERH